MINYIFHHICIQTNRYQESLEFYRDGLEMLVIEETPNFHGRDFNTWLQKGNFMIELQTPKQGKEFQQIDKEHSGINHICFLVEDIEKTCHDQLMKGLGELLLKEGNPVFEVNGGKLFKMKAPEGTIIEFRDKPGC